MKNIDATEQAYKNGYKQAVEDRKASDKPCDYCKGRAYTKKPVTVITAHGRRFQMVISFCPNCGRDLRPAETANSVTSQRTMQALERMGKKVHGGENG